MIINERTSTLERIGRAAHSSDLSHRSGRLTDADVLGAVGAAGIHHRHGSEILRMMLSLGNGDDEPTIREVVRAEGKRHGWSILGNSGLVARVARAALAHFRNPACPTCSGRSYIYAEHQQVTPCPQCDATGKRPVTGRFAREIRAVLKAMDRLRDEALEGINRQLGRPAWA